MQAWTLGPGRSGSGRYLVHPLSGLNLQPQLVKWGWLKLYRVDVNIRHNMHGVLSTLERQKGGRTVVIIIKEIVRGRLFFLPWVLKQSSPFFMLFCLSKNWSVTICWVKFDNTHWPPNFWMEQVSGTENQLQRLLKHTAQSLNEGVIQLFTWEIFKTCLFPASK